MTREPLVAWIREMLYARRFEERLISLYEAGAVPGHFHVYCGQEATGTGVLAHLGAEDVVYTTHRNHAHLLARGADAGRMFAEILGRRDGYCQGRGGTLHLAAPEFGVPATSGLVGGSVPQAVGAAFALRRLRPKALVVCFFGDGTFEEGALFEALNTAAQWKVPLLLVCENNGLTEDFGAAGAFPTSSTAAERLTNIPAAFSIPSVMLNGYDVEAVYRQVGEMVAAIRAGDGPQFIEATSVRWPGSRPLWPQLVGGALHVGWLTGDIEPPEQMRAWTCSADPLTLAVRRGLEDGVLTRGSFSAMDDKVRSLIDDAARWALSRPFPEPEVALQDIGGMPAAS